MFTSIGYHIKPGESRNFETNVYDYFPPLTKGRYRITKTYSYEKDNPITPDEVHKIYEEFIVN